MAWKVGEASNERGEDARVKWGLVQIFASGELRLWGTFMLTLNREHTLSTSIVLENNFVQLPESSLNSVKF